MSNKLYKLSRAVLPILLALSLAWLLLANSLSYSDVDLGWHLRVGQDIINDAQAPHLNYYNYAFADVKWLDHEWLLNLAMTAIFNSGGFISLHLFFLVITLIALFLTWRRWFDLFVGSGGHKFLFWLLALAGLWSSQPHLGIRVQTFGLLALSLLFLFLSNNFKYRRWLWFLPLLFMVWANAHGSFLLGLVLLAAYVVYAFLSPWLHRYPFNKFATCPTFTTKDKFQLIIIFGLSLSATLVNPYGLGLYAFLEGYSNTVYMKYIAEWRGQFVFPLYYPQILYLSFSAAIFILYWQQRSRRLFISWWDAGLVTVFFALSLQSRRHFPIFVIVSLPLVTGILQQALVEFKWQINLIFKKLAISLLVFLLTVSLVTLFWRLPWHQDNIRDFCDIKYPCAALDYLKSRPETKDWRLFNEYAWGGFLLWSYPEKQVFIDGRMPQATFGQHTVLEEYFVLRSATTDPGKVLDSYNIRLVLLRAENKSLSLQAWEKFFFQISDNDLSTSDKLRLYLDSNPEWQLVFSDKLSLIYERR